MAHQFKVGDRVTVGGFYPERWPKLAGIQVISEIYANGKGARFEGHCFVAPLSLLEPVPAPVLIDPAKTYRTRDGRAVRIYATDGGGKYPVHGAIQNGEAWEGDEWSGVGAYYADETVELDGDLVEVKPEREGWLNVYDHDNSWRSYSLSETRDEADRKADPTHKRIACLHVKFTEGEGLV